VKDGAIAVGRDFSAGGGFIFAGGDAVGANSVIGAIADGHMAACYMDRMLSGGNPVLEVPAEPAQADKDSVAARSGHIRAGQPPGLITRAGWDRNSDFNPYTRTMTAQEAAAEAKRCLKCGCGKGCALCVNICCEFAAGLAGSDEIAIDRNACVACGMCYNRCPNKNIEMVRTGGII